MSDQRDKHVPTAIADAPAEARSGDYLAPPQQIPFVLTLKRSIPITLICIIISLYVFYLVDFLDRGSAREPQWQVWLAVDIGRLIFAYLAIFRSRRWPTPALWLALAGIVGSMFISN
jgi:hypothetical protein